MNMQHSPAHNTMLLPGLHERYLSHNTLSPLSSSKPACLLTTYWAPSTLHPDNVASVNDDVTTKVFCYEVPASWCRPKALFAKCCDVSGSYECRTLSLHCMKIGTITVVTHQSYLLSCLIVFIILHAMLSGAVYCYRSCLWRVLFVGGLVCYHDNSKLHASIFTKLGP